MATRYRLFPDAEPQPDRQNPPREPYGEGLPGPQDVLPIEVAGASLDQGRPKERVFPGEAKAPLAHPDRPIPCR